jgi:hypothetical protein
MESQFNVDLYLDDWEIIDVLRPIPPLPEAKNKNILKFLQEDTSQKNMGCTILYEGKVYTLLKFDKDKYVEETEAGLVLMVSEPIHAGMQAQMIAQFKEMGGSFPEHIEKVLSETLKAIELGAAFRRSSG